MGARKTLGKSLGNQSVLEFIVCLLLYLTACFPFVTFIRLGPDTQPWAMLVAFFIAAVCFFRKQIHWKNWIVKVIVAFFVYVSLLGVYSVFVKGNLFESVRSYANYFSIIVIPIATYFVLQKQGGLKERNIKIAINIWLVVGLVQKFIYREFMYFILSAHRTSETRGVVSLAVEPSYYGTVCLFFLLFVLLFERHKLIYMINLCFQVAFLAESSVTLVYFAVIAGCYIVSCAVHPSKRNIIVCVCAIAAFLLVWFFVLPPLSIRIDGRIGNLLWKLLNKPQALLKDESIRDRYVHILMALENVISNYGLPTGFLESRIMSGYGALLQECGLPGLVVIGMQVFVVYKGNEDDKTMALAVSVALAILMFSAIQLAMPLFSMYLGFCYYRYRTMAKPEEKKLEA